MNKSIREVIRSSLVSLQYISLTAIAFLLSLNIGTSAVWALQVSDIPDLSEIKTLNAQTWVIDDSDVLSATTKNAIASKAEKLAESTGTEVHVVAIRRIDLGQPATEFASELFDKWFPSEAEKENQVLLFMATEDHRTAIQTGAKVKEILPDSIASSIADETMLYPARKANYNQAVNEGMARLETILNGNPDPGAPLLAVEETETSNYATREETEASSSNIVVIILLILATLLPMATYYWLQSQP
ncbi:photosystem II repair protein Psb32 [Pseudanabaena mucicola]|uniref:TPM domain-containing protein n=1 Tax=Pseudanabaena mucicola FACHB-723 TaxID=2692860 RepID=A0ABR7ZX04_9CYAN|nr:TPM domain-containing protein [Pseudanabaena mucicola]MBD2188299.1 TPM domain-containing protein [Pseudanabaena mucicola FACHB-723]